MPRLQVAGVCRACGARFSAQQIRKHLANCPKRSAGDSSAFDVRASAGPYWAFLETPSRATLQHLDAALRRLWVECCGHLSRFTIEGTEYELQTGGVDAMWAGMFGGRGPSRSMKAPLSGVLRPGLTFGYEYDFGSTTALKLEVLSERSSGLKKNEVFLVARNDPPPFPCDACKKDPRALVNVICTECQQGLCASCAKKHECDEDMQLPLVNSPRAGVCGYTGSE
jgi:hypothetical protein